MRIGLREIFGKPDAGSQGTGLKVAVEAFRTPCACCWAQWPAPEACSLFAMVQMLLPLLNLETFLSRALLHTQFSVGGGC